MLTRYSEGMVNNRRPNRGEGQASSRDSRLSAVRRHAHRSARSSITGPFLTNPESRIARFEQIAQSALHLIQHEVGDELRDVQIGFATAPAANTVDLSANASEQALVAARLKRDNNTGGESNHPLYYAIDRKTKTIMMFRMPIQRAKVLHIDDAEHRAFFIGHCVHRAVCEYLGREPWELLPGRFDHY